MKFSNIFLSLTIFLDMSSRKQTLLSSALEKECANLALVLILQEVNVKLELDAQEVCIVNVHDRKVSESKKVRRSIRL